MNRGESERLLIAAQASAAAEGQAAFCVNTGIDEGALEVVGQIAEKLGQRGMPVNVAYRSALHVGYHLALLVQQRS